MKKFLIISTLLISAFTAAKAQEGGGAPQNAVKINPLSLILATGNISYERAISAHSSFQLGGFFSGFKISGVKYSGFGITPEFRFYVAGRKEALNGVYIGPFVRYQSYTIKDDDGDKANYSSIGGGALLGWEKTWTSGFVLDLFFGPQYNSGKVKDQSGGSDIDVAGSVDGFGLRTGITLGFAF